MKGRVTFVSDDVSGGAAVACRRLVRALRQDEANDISWVALKARGMGNVLHAGEWSPIMDTFLYRLVSRFSSDEPLLRRFGDQVGNRGVYKLVQRQSPGLVHLHGLHEGLSFELVSFLRTSFPIVWTLHDMWPLTGYCYYSYECDKYLHGCQGGCPQLGRCGAAVRAPAAEWCRRTRVYQAMKKRLAFVAPSRWLAECARKRFEGQVRVDYIPNGVDLGVFRPLGDKVACRKVLGLPLDRPIVLTGAMALNDPRKGAALLSQVCAELGSGLNAPPLLVGLGGQSNATFSGNVCMAGMVADERLMNLYYNAADVFVLPTRADNLPNMLIEAVAAGTPVVASGVGGCGDVVCDDETGFLAAVDDVSAMGDALHRVLSASPAQHARWGEQCRAHAEREYDAHIQAARYRKIYDDLM